MKIKMMMKKTTKIGIVVLLAMLAADWVYLRQVPRQSTVNEDNLRQYSQDELAKYDGSDLNKPIYLAYEGYVYDVSSGRADFYNPGEAYHYLVGKDSTKLLNVFGGDLIKRKYSVVGKYSP